MFCVSEYLYKFTSVIPKLIHKWTDTLCQPMDKTLEGQGGKGTLSGNTISAKQRIS